MSNTKDMSNTTDLIARRHAVVPRAVGQFAGAIAVESASGAHLTDVDGEAWIDFAGGIGVMNVGHCDERVVRAIQEQAARLIHTCIHVATYEPYVALCEKLVSLLPHGASTKAVLLNSGAEAVENAVKFARQATGRPALICFTDAFHGRTMMGMSLTSKTRYKVGCGPFAPEIYRLPYPNHFRNGDGLDMDAFVERELSRVEDAFVNLVPADHVAAVVIEPILGEGGFIPAPSSYLKGLRQICDAHGILLIFDEVQSGFGRTGRWASYEHAGVTPDLSTWAKSMGGGMPISAVVGRADVMDAAEPGTVGGTYGGNPVACAAALAAIETIEESGLLERAVEIGDAVRTRFESVDRPDLVADVRGLGAMIGLELCHDGDPNRPAAEAVAAVTAACRERRVLVLPAGPHGNVIRVLSPLTIDDDDLERGLAAIEDGVMAIAREPLPA
jgi:4-aminobutyrate aminotransferase/(S)-3-amino-2-methylpropionate transaminase